MALRATRLLTALVAGGLVTGSVLLGAGAASAAPADTVPARCGQTVRAAPGDTVTVTPLIGRPFTVPVLAGMDPISELVGGVLCRVQVDVIEPVASSVADAAPPLAPAAETLGAGTGAVLEPSTRARATPRTQATPAPPAAPAAAPAPVALAPSPTAAAAFAPAFGALPTSFLRSASAPGPAPGLRFDAGLLLGSAFPGLRAGAPAYLGYDAASAVTTASQVQALPVDGLSEGGVGVPALLAVLALSGVAAFTVRRAVLGRGATPAPRPMAEERDPAGSDVTPAAVAGAADARALAPA